jgi:predicted anti-sigma-YlaC factor YlaD
VLERYVEAGLGGRKAEARFPVIGLHLTKCPACRAEHDGLLALIAPGHQPYHR